MDSTEIFLIGAAVGGAAAYGLVELVQYLRRARPPTGAPRARGPSQPWGSDIAAFAPPAAAPVGNGGEAIATLVAPGTPSPPVESVRISRRIVLHLFAQGRTGPDDVGRPEATQRGICAAVGAEQSAVSKVLRRLVAAGVVDVSRRNVRGGDRRVNVYGLTRRGELVAHELRARAASSSAGSDAAAPEPTFRPGLASEPPSWPSGPWPPNR